jgi:hypothetical protein
VLEVRAPPVSTQMIGLKPFWDRPDEVLEDETVGILNTPIQ